MPISCRPGRRGEEEDAEGHPAASPHRPTSGLHSSGRGHARRSHRSPHPKSCPRSDSSLRRLPNATESEVELQDGPFSPLPSPRWGGTHRYLGDGQPQGNAPQQDEVAVDPVDQLVNAAVGVDEGAGLQVAPGLHALPAHGVDDGLGGGDRTPRGWGQNWKKRGGLCLLGGGLCLLGGGVSP